MQFYYKYEPLLHLNDSAYDVIALTGGRGSLKTGHVLRGVLTACMAEKKRVCFFRETRDALSESLKAELDGLIDGEFAARGYTYNKETVMYANGSYMFFKGLREVNKASIENLKGIATSTDFFVVDEAQAVSKPVWDALIPTLRKKGCVLIVIYNRIDDKLPVEECLFLDYDNMSAPEKTYFLEVNYPEIEHLGILTEQFIARAELVKKNKPDEYKTIYLNRVKDRSDNAVVKYWDKNNINDGIRYCDDLPVHITTDFNVGSMAWVLCHRDGKDIFAFDEICVENTNTQDCVNEFIRRYPAHKARIIINGDASGNMRRTESPYSNFAVMHHTLVEHGYDVQLDIHTYNPPVNYRIDCFNQGVMGNAGERHVFAHSRCTELINAMKQLKYKIGTGIIDSPTPKQLETDKTMLFAPHIFDAVSYLYEFYNPITL